MMRLFLMILTGFCMVTAELYGQDALWWSVKTPAGYVPADKIPHWHDRVHQFSMEVPRPGCWLFLGNSLTEGFDLAHYFPEWPVVNRGIKSDHLDGMLSRLSSVFEQKPAKIFILAGINDIGRKCPNVHIQVLYKQLVDTLQTGLPEGVFYLQSVLPTTPRWKNCSADTIILINRFIKELAMKKKMHFIDLHSLMVDSSGHYLRPEWTVDGLHLNEEGYTIWAETLKKLITP